MDLPSWLQVGNAAARGSPVRSRKPNASFILGFVWPFVVVVAVELRSTHARRPGCQFGDPCPHGVVMSWICVAMIATLSVSLQCAGEKVIGPFHGYCTKVFGFVQLFQS